MLLPNAARTSFCTRKVSSLVHREDVIAPTAPRPCFSWMRLNSAAAYSIASCHETSRHGCVDRFANQRARDAIRMRRVAPREAPLDARVAVIGLPVGVRHHPRDEVALHLGAERASDAAVSAGRDDAVIRLAEFDDRFFHQRRGRTRLHARAARNAFGRRERTVLSRRNHRRKSAPVNRQREGALHFLARADASRAHDAFRRIESEIRIRLILLRVQMIGAVAVAIAHFAQADRARHVLQLAIAVGGTGQAVERMIGNVQLHHAAPQSRERGTLGAHFHPGANGSGARSRIAALAFDFDQAQAARAERFERIGRAQFRDMDSGLGGRANHRRAFGHRDHASVDFERDRWRAGTKWCGEIAIAARSHGYCQLLMSRSSGRRR